MADDLSWLDPNFAQQPGLMASPPATGPGLFGRMGFGAPQGSPQSDALMATAASLLAGSGYSPVRRSSAEILGSALLAGQQARAAAQDRIMKQQLMQAQIEHLKNRRDAFGTIDVDQFTPESLAKFQTTGNYGDLVRRPDAAVGHYNPGEFTPESWTEFVKSGYTNPGVLKRWVTPANPILGNVNQVPTIITPPKPGVSVGPTTAPVLNPLSTVGSEADAARAKAAAEGQGKAQGTATGEAQGGIIKRSTNANTVEGMLDLAEPLIDASTGSLTGAAADKIAGAFGKSLKGAEAAAQLKIIQAGLMTNMPRMEGPQSDRDVRLYEQASGQLGDPTVPNGIKKVAVKTIRQLQEKYKDAAKQVPEIIPNSSPAARAADQSSIQRLLDKYPARGQ